MDRPAPFLVSIASKAKDESAWASVIKQVTEDPAVFFFGEVVKLPSFQELSQISPSLFALMNLFAYGVYSDYTDGKSSYPELSEKQLKKLQCLTILSMASKSRILHYKDLQSQLNVSLRELEDLIIQTIYVDVLKGSIDQEAEIFFVDFAKSRDIPTENLQDLSNSLSNWLENCDKVLEKMDEGSKAAEMETKVRLESEQNLKNKIKEAQDMAKKPKSNGRDHLDHLDADKHIQKKKK